MRVGPSESFAEGGASDRPSFGAGSSLGGYAHQGVILARRTIRGFRRGGASDRPRVSPRGGVGPSESFAEGYSRVGPSESFAEGGVGPSESFAEGGVGPSESFAEGYSLGYANQGVILARRTIREFRRGGGVGPSESFAEGGRRTVREFRRGGRRTVREFRRGLQPRVR